MWAREFVGRKKTRKAIPTLGQLSDEENENHPTGLTPKKIIY